MRKSTKDTLASLATYGAGIAVTTYATYANAIEYLETNNPDARDLTIFSGLFLLSFLGLTTIGNSSRKQKN